MSVWTMKYKLLGRTKLKVSLIGFGGGPLEVIKKDEAISLIKHGIEKGINIIDVDKVHKDNEEKVGNALIKKRENMYIMAKSFATTKVQMHRAIKESLVKLDTSYIDIYQMHLVRDSKDLYKRLQGSLLSLKKAQKDNKINFIGISGHHFPTLIEAIKTNQFDTVLIPYNLGHIIAEEELFDVAKSYNVGIITMKPFGGGMLVDPKFYGEKSYDKARDMTAENALKFALSNKNISCVLVGFNKKEQIDEAVRISNKKIIPTKKEITLMNKRVYDFLSDDYCRNCKYCLPCEGTNGQLEIDDILKLYTYYTKYGYKIRPKIEYSELKIKADSCIKCGKCIPKCPYHISIPERLLKAHKSLTITDSDLKEWAAGEVHICSTNELKQKYIEYYVNSFKHNNEIKKYHDEVIQIKKELLENERKIKNQNRMIIERDENIKNNEKEVHKLNDEILKKDQEIKKLDIILRTKEEQLRSLHEKLIAKEKELYDIYNSKMYKYVVSNIWKIHRTTKKLLSRK